MKFIKICIFIYIINIIHCISVDKIGIKKHSRCTMRSEQLDVALLKLKGFMVCSQSDTINECKNIIFDDAASVKEVERLNPNAYDEGYEGDEPKLKVDLVTHNHEYLKDMFTPINPIESGLPNEEIVSKVSNEEVVSEVSNDKVESSEIVELQISNTVGNRRQYVNTVVDFYFHTSMHKQRVSALSIELIKKFPKQFPGISVDDVKKLMPLHDNFKMYGTITVDGKQTKMYAELWKWYGKRPPMDLIDALNIGDDNIMKEGQLKRWGSGAAAKIEKFKDIERLADLVDRINNKVSPEEFGRKMYPPGPDDMKGKKAEMYKYLEKNYAKLTKGLDFERLSAKKYYQLSRKLLIDRRFRTIMSGARTFAELSARAFAPIARMAASRMKAGLSLVGRWGCRLLRLAELPLLLLHTTTLGCDNGPFQQYDYDEDCNAQIGLTPKVIEYLTLPFDEQLMWFKQQPQLCEAIKGTTKVVDENLFEEIACGEGSTKMHISEGFFKSSITVSHDSNGDITNMKFFNTGSYYSGAGPVSMQYENGKVVKYCRMMTGRGMRHIEHCSEGFQNSEAINNWIGSINLKIQQGIACCLGKTNMWNKEIQCSRNAGPE